MFLLAFCYVIELPELNSSSTFNYHHDLIFQNLSNCTFPFLKGKTRPFGSITSSKSAQIKYIDYTTIHIGAVNAKHQVIDISIQIFSFISTFL